MLRHSQLFFGRDKSIHDVIEDLRAAALVVIVGASGSGKSSLVLGGVLPNLRSESWAKDFVIVPTFVPGAAILEHLVTSARREVGANRADLAAEVEALRRDPSRLLEMVGGKSSPTLIVIDQFEEVFTLADKSDRDAAIAALAAFLSKGRRNRVILTVRDEFEAQMREHILFSPPCQARLVQNSGT